MSKLLTKGVLKQMDLPETLVFVGQQVSSSVRLRAFDEALSQTSSANTVNNTNQIQTAIAVDQANGAIYIGVGSQLQKYDLALNHVWTYTAGANIWGISVDSAGDIYIASQAASNNVRKISAAGSLLIQQTVTGANRGIKVDNNGDILVVGTSLIESCAKLTPDLSTTLWTYDHGATLIAVNIDGDNNVIIGGGSGSGVVMRKLNGSTGALLFNFDSHGTTLFAVGVDSAGNYYSSGNVSSSQTTRKYDSAGNIIASYNHGANLNHMSIGSNNRIYICGVASGGVTIRALDTSLSVLNNYSGGATALSIAAS